jgi:hypothetical protein
LECMFYGLFFILPHALSQKCCITYYIITMSIFFFIDFFLFLPVGRFVFVLQIFFSFFFTA